jgi:hypothetical protein
MRGRPLRADISRGPGGATSVAVALLLLALSGGAGCGPFGYIAAVPLRASPAAAQAESLDAERYAPYEMTAAHEYLHHARELAGYARFQSAHAFAAKAEASALKAQELSHQRSMTSPAR